MTDLTGRRALVTGGSRGIGSAIAAAYAAAGMRVAIGYHTADHDAERTLRGLAGEGHAAIRADVADPREVERMVAEARDALGGLDVLVNNAGIYELQPFDMADYAAWQASWLRVLQTNLMSAANAAFCALPGFLAQGSGRIINVASRAAFRGETEAPAYGASKAGMVNLTRCLARSLAGRNVLAFGIAPGWVETAMARDSVKNMLPAILAEIPLGRMATVEDVAGVALFLASDAADYLTGQTIPVTGGSWFTT